MAKAEVFAGVCGFKTIIETRLENDICKVDILSDCAAIQRMANELTEVDPYREISYRRKMPLVIEMAVKYCSHTACPVPVGIIKAIEVEANLALPADATIKVSKT